MRRATLLLCLFDFGAWLWIALSLFNTGSDAATRGLDLGALGAVSILFGLTALPAFLLANFRRAPRLALALALGFPAGFLILFLAAVTAYA